MATLPPQDLQCNISTTEFKPQLMALSLICNFSIIYCGTFTKVTEIYMKE